jgi:hypothetical protein
VCTIFEKALKAIVESTLERTEQTRKIISMNSTNVELASSESVIVERNESIVWVEKFQSEEMKTDVFPTY